MNLQLLRLTLAMLMVASYGELVSLAQQPAEDLSWGKPVSVGNGCHVEQTKDTLKLTVDKGPRDLSAELNITDAPRVMREVSGDFVIQVRVTPDFRLRGQSLIGGRPVFCSAGLLLWKSKTDYVRLERAMYVMPQKPVVDYMSFDRRKAGQWVINRDRPAVNRAAKSWYLKLERDGDTVTGSISENGKDWRSPQRINISDFPQRLLVGVAVCSTSKAPISATFDSLTLRNIDQE